MSTEAAAKSALMRVLKLIKILEKMPLLKTPAQKVARIGNHWMTKTVILQKTPKVIKISSKSITPPLQSLQKGDTDRRVSIFTEESHEVSETNEHHDIDVLVQGVSSKICRTGHSIVREDAVKDDDDKFTPDTESDKGVVQGQEAEHLRHDPLTTMRLFLFLFHSF